jgi:hypothetical protein
MDIFRKSIGGALDLAHTLKENAGARRNEPANRRYLMRRITEECEGEGFKVEVAAPQAAVFPAMKVALELGDKELSLSIEYGGEDWSNIVFGILAQVVKCDEVTVFLQLEVREARAYICCMQPHDGVERPRKVTLVDVVDRYSLTDAYLAARREMEQSK